MAIFNLNNDFERQQFKDYVNEQFKMGGIIEIIRKHHKRSMAQNAYLHLILGLYASEFGYTLDEVKYDIFKKKVNADIFTRKRVNRRGEEVTYMRSTTELDTAEMTLAIDKFRNWSSAVAGLYIPAPNEYQALTFAQQQVERYKEFI